MKKIGVIFLLLLAFMFASCTVDDIFNAEQRDNGVQTAQVENEDSKAQSDIGDTDEQEETSTDNSSWTKFY